MIGDTVVLRGFGLGYASHVGVAGIRILLPHK